MAAEPFIAIPVTNPDAIKSLMIGPRPTLTTCPPKPQRIGFPEEWAYRIVRTRLRRPSPARICGSFERKPGTFSEPSSGLPNMDVLTLLLRDSSEYVEMPAKSKGLMEYSESTMNR